MSGDEEEFELASHPDYEPRPAIDPTGAKAGSEAKLEVMRQRIATGQAAFHPDDNPRKVEQ